MRTSRRTGRIVALGAAIMLVVAACGGTDTGSDANGATTAATDSSVPATTSSTSPPTTTTTAAPGTSTTTAAPVLATCDHPYFPARDGASWTWENLDGDLAVWTIVSTSDDGTEATMEADLTSPEGEITATVNLICGDFGVSAPELAITGLPAGAEVTQITEEGVWLLPADQLTEGATWMSLVTISAELPGDVAFEIERVTNYTVLGFEDVTVPAGTFPAIKVRAEAAFKIDVGGRTIQNDRVDIFWFSEGVGFVKESSEVAKEGDDPEFSSELVEYFLP
jgi:hypothetical protein